MIYATQDWAAIAEELKLVELVCRSCQQERSAERAKLYKDCQE